MLISGVAMRPRRLDPDPANAAHRRARESKLRHARLFADLAGELGAPDPERLGDLLALLYDGAPARAQVLDDVAPLEHARQMAAMLLDDI